MDKNKKIAIYILIIAALISFMYWYLNRKKDVNLPTSSQELPLIFPLKKGSKGLEVKQLQAYLLTKFGAKFVYGIDGDFGNETTSKVKKFLGVDQVDEALFKSQEMDKIKV